MSPALTKPTDITDVAVEDWINAVIPAPTRTPIILFPVSFARTLFNFSPAIACKLPLVILTLYKNKAIPEQSPNNAGHTSAIKNHASKLAKQNTSDSQPIYYLLRRWFSRFWIKYQSLFWISDGRSRRYIDVCLYIRKRIPWQSLYQPCFG